MSQANTQLHIPNISVGFLGKLPVFTDFVKYNSSGKEIQIIDEWMQDGISFADMKHKNEWKNYYEKSALINFIYPFTGTDNFILGIIFPSNDKSGRKFPFIVLYKLEKTITGDVPYYLIPLVYEVLYSSLKNVIRDYNSLIDIELLKSIIREIKLSNTQRFDASEEYNNFIHSTKLHDVVKLENENFIEVVNIFENKLKVFDHLLIFEFDTNHDNQNKSFLISFYIQLFLKAFRKLNLMPGIFWTQSEDGFVVLFLFFDKPTASNFFDLLYYQKNQPVKTVEITNLENRSYQSLTAIFRKDSVVNKNIKLNEFLISINKYFN